MEVINQRVMAQSSAQVRLAATQWAAVVALLEEIRDHLVQQTDFLRDGGDGHGPGWRSAAAAEFLKMGPGATLKSVHDWHEAAVANQQGLTQLATVIDNYQSYETKGMEYLYLWYLDAIYQAQDAWLSTVKNYTELMGRPSQWPPTPQMLEQAYQKLERGPKVLRDDFIDSVRRAAMEWAVKAQHLEYAMAQAYLGVLGQYFHEGSSTLFEGPQNAVDAPDKPFSVNLPAFTPTLPVLPTPTLPDPGTPDPGTLPGTPSPPTLDVPPGLTDPAGLTAPALGLGAVGLDGLGVSRPDLSGLNALRLGALGAAGLGAAPGLAGLRNGVLGAGAGAARGMPPAGLGEGEVPPMLPRGTRRRRDTRAQATGRPVTGAALEPPAEAVPPVLRTSRRTRRTEALPPAPVRGQPLPGEQPEAGVPPVLRARSQSRREERRTSPARRDAPVETPGVTPPVLQTARRQRDAEREESRREATRMTVGA